MSVEAQPAGDPDASSSAHAATDVRAGAVVDGATAVAADAVVEADGEVPGGRKKRRWLPRPVWHIGRLLILALVVEYLVLPNIAGTRKAISQLLSVDPLLLVLGVALEAGAIVAYAGLTRSVIGPNRSPSMGTLLRIQLTTLSVSHVVPGGSAAGSTLGYRLMTQAGVQGTDVSFALATQALGSALVLNVIFWVALVVSIPVWGFSPLYLTAALVGMVLVVVFSALVLVLTRGEHWAGGLIERTASRFPFIKAEMIRRAFDRLAARMRELGTHRRMMVHAALWALANWLLDAAALFVFVGAFGHWVNPDGLLVAYGLANVLAAIPLTPGGLGVIEATLTSALVGFDTTRAIAILGVVTYRLVNFWIPIPVGGLTYLSLQVDPGRRGEPLRHLRNVRSWLTGPVEAWRRRPGRQHHA